MKKVLLYFTCIISLLINCFILEVDDFNFKIIDSPLGSQYQLDAVKKLDGSYLIATQWWKKIYDSLNIYKIYFSLDDGNTWELHDQNAYTGQYSIFELYNDTLYGAPISAQTNTDIPPSAGLHKSGDYGQVWYWVGGGAGFF
ncbi:MAG: hypothetical protein A2X61_04335 [Ignavibacteria bacterium GWB2_35_12]|nr:MAG: hypothetical protein A2X63_00995 [Ignavibacteria bacterium GWA2_35_8]OGU38918.1 MAG: hypothetical protein A2X61_04335 [Ignavibacteria bacterium GWB2_35_12]OGU88408.1 MAG: hypothetical protein A2220_05045 [Ignavibacteria bacterium RIFOXYA2_FULL_35_10]OGV20396.1 MAG: hypothetical protein A2475_12110 [Ignavibacteria bacterium RIFOXYC2_FULL_35_21]